MLLWLYIYYSSMDITIRIGEEVTNFTQLGRGVRQGCLLSPLLFSLYAEFMMAEALDDLEVGIKVGGKLIKDVRFADDQAMIDGTNEGLQEMMDKLNEKAQEYGMKINVKKTKVMKVSRNGGGEVNIYIEGQRVEQTDKFKYLGSWLTDDGRCELEVKCRIAMAKEAFGKRKELLTRSLQRETKKRIIKSIIWPIMMYGSETWVMKSEECRRIQAFEMWLWRRMEKIKWTEKVTNDSVLATVNEKYALVEKIKKVKKSWIGHVIRGEGLMKEVMEGRMEGKRTRGRKRISMLQDLLEANNYAYMKKKAEDRERDGGPGYHKPA